MLNSSANVNNALANGQAAVDKTPSLAEGACLVTAKASGACGEATLPSTKVELQGKQVSSKLIHSGTIQWFPSEALRFVSSASTAISRIAHEFGASLGGFTVVPLTQLDVMLDRLKQERGKFYEALKKLEADFDAVLDKHKADNPDVAHLIEKYRMDKAAFIARFSFKVTPPVSLVLVSGEKSDEDETKGQLADAVMATVHKEAPKVYKALNKPSGKVRRSALAGYKRLMTKLFSFAFADASLMTVYEAMSDELERLPKTGPIEGSDLVRLQRWSLVLADPEVLQAHLEGDDQLAEEEDLAQESQTMATTDAVKADDSDATPSAPVVQGVPVDLPSCDEQDEDVFGIEDW